MTIDIDRARRLSAMNIDDRTRAILREVAPIITPDIDSIIEDAFRAILRYPEVAKIYEGIRFQDMIAGQRKQWLEELFPATFTDEQLQGSISLFVRRQQMQLQLRWFFVFYSALLRGFISKVAPSYRKQPARLVEVLNALSSVMLFTLDVASAAYMK
jgi:hypothetical protein